MPPGSPLPNPAPPSCLHVPPDWREAAERIRRAGTRRAMVIGGTDAGKSTLCGFLADQGSLPGRSVALLDADVGQKMFGPPASVTLFEPQGVQLSFVGATDPVRGWARLIPGMHHLADTARVDLLLINTSGLLAGPGRALKAAKIRATRPDLLVAVGNGPGVEAVLRDHPDLPCLRLTRSPEARRKTEGERRAARRDAFRRYFAASSVRELRLADAPSVNGLCDAGTGLLVGLAGDQGHLGLGILCGCPEAAVRVLTSVEPESVRQIIPGFIRLDETFSEAALRNSGAVP